MMEEYKRAEEEKYLRAKERVAMIKGFYIHLAIYVLINLFILVNIYLREHYESRDFWQWEHFAVLFFWGIGLAFHGIRVFVLQSWFGRTWEQKQIQKYMERDERESQKYQ